LPAARPPGPTLFPYTPLFRSKRRGCPRHPDRDRLTPADSGWGVVRLGGAVRAPVNSARRYTLFRLRFTSRCEKTISFADGSVLGDRKSTRLNSSHVAISYAVF